MIKIFKKAINSYRDKIKIGDKIIADEVYIATKKKNTEEIHKRPRRTEIINYFLSKTDSEYYLEIGTRDPQKNFDRIQCQNKYSVDPGVEFMKNPVTYKFTSDCFFDRFTKNLLDIKNDIKFDVIFIDGLHISNQVDKDIQNSLKYIKDDGFVILHDCNPPSEYHQREDYRFINSPAGPFWNGTTWKAFYKYRHEINLYSICFDSDWGIGVISKKQIKHFNQLRGLIENEYYEYEILNLKRKEYLNLHNFEKWRNIIEQ